MPHDYTNVSADSVTAITERAIAEAESLVETIVTTDEPRTYANTLEPLDRVGVLLADAAGEGSFMARVHPDAEVRAAGDVLDPRRIAQHDNLRCINSALSVDLRGQVNAESFGWQQTAGVGGQLDFFRGAGLRDDALRIITLASQTSKGLPRIVSGHPAGSETFLGRQGGVGHIVPGFKLPGNIGLKFQRQHIGCFFGYGFFH